MAESKHLTTAELLLLRERGTFLNDLFESAIEALDAKEAELAAHPTVREGETHVTFTWKGTEFLFRRDGKFEGWSRIRPCDPLEVEVRKLMEELAAAMVEVARLKEDLKITTNHDQLVSNALVGTTYESNQLKAKLEKLREAVAAPNMALESLCEEYKALREAAGLVCKIYHGDAIDALRAALGPGEKAETKENPS